MPLVRCRFYTSEGAPIKGGCVRAGCDFVHPSEPAWRNARICDNNRSRTIRSGTGGIPSAMQRREAVSHESVAEPSNITPKGTPTFDEQGRESPKFWLSGIEDSTTNDQELLPSVGNGGTHSTGSWQRTPGGETNSRGRSALSTPFNLNCGDAIVIDKGKQRADKPKGSTEKEILPSSSGIKRRSTPLSESDFPLKTKKKLLKLDAIDTMVEEKNTVTNSAGPSSLSATPCSTWTPLPLTPQYMSLRHRRISAAEAKTLQPGERRKRNLKRLFNAMMAHQDLEEINALENDFTTALYGPAFAKPGTYGGKLLNRDKRSLRDRAEKMKREYSEAIRSATHFEEYVKEMSGASIELDSAREKDDILNAEQVIQMEARIDMASQLFQEVNAMLEAMSGNAVSSDQPETLPEMQLLSERLDLLDQLDGIESTAIDKKSVDGVVQQRVQAFGIDDSDGDGKFINLFQREFSILQDRDDLAKDLVELKGYVEGELDADYSGLPSHLFSSLEHVITLYSEIDRCFAGKEETYSSLVEHVSSQLKSLEQDIEKYTGSVSNQSSSAYFDNLIDELLPSVLPHIRDMLGSTLAEILKDTTTNAAQAFAEFERQTVNRIYSQLQPLHRVSAIGRMSIERHANSSSAIMDSTRCA